MFTDYLKLTKCYTSSQIRSKTELNKQTNFCIIMFSKILEKLISNRLRNFSISIKGFMIANLIFENYKIQFLMLYLIL